MQPALSAKSELDSRTQCGALPSSPQEAKVVEYLVDALADAGVPYIFGVIGGAVVPLFTATVGRRTQIVMAKPVMFVASTETIWPAQTRLKANMPAGRRG